MNDFENLIQLKLRIISTDLADLLFLHPTVLQNKYYPLRNMTTEPITSLLSLSLWERSSSI
jgi:hypothetical protein